MASWADILATLAMLNEQGSQTLLPPGYTPDPASLGEAAEVYRLGWLSRSKTPHLYKCVLL